MTPVKKRKCMNCLLPTHSYKECPDPCRFCNSHDHKARSCKKNRSNIKRTVKKGSNPPNSNSTTLSIEQSSNSASLDKKPPTLNSLSLNDVSTVLSENGVFTISVMTSAATLPSFFKSITILKDQLKFRTNNGTEGSINLHAYEDNVRDVREAF